MDWFGSLHKSIQNFQLSWRIICVSLKNIQRVILLLFREDDPESYPIQASKETVIEDLKNKSRNYERSASQAKNSISGLAFGLAAWMTFFWCQQINNYSISINNSIIKLRSAKNDTICVEKCTHLFCILMTIWKDIPKPESLISSSSHYCTSIWTHCQIKYTIFMVYILSCWKNTISNVRTRTNL